VAGRAKIRGNTAGDSILFALQRKGFFEICARCGERLSPRAGRIELLHKETQLRDAGCFDFTDTCGLPRDQLQRDPGFDAHQRHREAPPFQQDVGSSLKP